MAAAEQAIVKWEDDSEVRKCRICLYVPSLALVHQYQSQFIILTIKPKTSL